MSIFRGKHTLLNYSNFFIQHKNIDSAFMNIKLMCRNILSSNSLRVVGEASALLPNGIIVSPDGFTMAFLLDESHLSLHSYTNSDPERGEVIGKLACDLFTCTKDPINHFNAIRDLNKFIIDNYDAVLDEQKTVDRF
jgi:S-adenosylmethionine/arginine decarboxylase-like enzyme